MKIEVPTSREPALRLEFSRAELPVLRALLERASFIDTRPQDQAAALDLAARLLAALPEETRPRT